MILISRPSSIDVKAPGQELVAAAGTGDDHAHKDVSIAIRAAFESMSRRLHDYCGRRH